MHAWPPPEWRGLLERFAVQDERLRALEALASADRGSGAGLITAERLRQVGVEGWSVEHDLAEHQHPGRDGLPVRAAELVLDGVLPNDDAPRIAMSPDGWGLVKKHRPDRVRQLVIAGALIAAEIDRLLAQ